MAIGGIKAWYLRQPIIGKYLLVALPVLLTCSLAYLVFLSVFQNEAARVALRQQAQEQAEQAARILVRPLWLFEMSIVRRILDVMPEASGVVCIELFDLTGGHIPMRAGDCDPRADTYRVVVPMVETLMDVRPTVLGQLALTVDLEAGTRLLSFVWPPVSMLGLLVTLIVATVVIGFRRIVHQPLGALRAALAQHEQTGARARVSWPAADEIGTVVEAYNQALAREERREAELRTQLTFRSVLLNTIPNPIVVQNEEGRIIATNPAFLALLDRPETEVLDRRLEDLLPGSAWSLLAQALLDGAGSSQDTLETTIRLPDDVSRTVLLTVAHFTWSGETTTGLVTVMQDITARKQIEQALRQAKDDAEMALTELKLAQDSLIQAEKLASLGQMVAGMAHEINTPLGISMTTATGLARQTRLFRDTFASSRLRKSDLESFLEQTAESSRLLVTNTTRAAELIQSFKRVSSDQASEWRRQFRLKQFIDDVMLSLRPELKRTKLLVRVTCYEGIVVDSYPGALAQVLTNLVVNSIRHGYAPGDEGELTIHVVEPEPGLIRLDYTDDGCGIDPTMQNRIFDRFFTTQQDRGGTGLGLHIVQRLVTQTLGGSITLASTPGNGCRFTLQFPTRIGAGETEAAA